MRFGGLERRRRFDQILSASCAPSAPSASRTPAAEGIAELRIDMKTAAQGNGDPASNGDGKGYNPPSLLNVVTRRALSARRGTRWTLESRSSRRADRWGRPCFATHYNALAPNFLTGSNATTVQTQVAQLVAYLTSIDGTTTAVDAPAVGSGGGDFCVFP